jgi:F-type H+-transporting ATPase subunit b
MNILSIVAQEAEQAQPSLLNLNLGVSAWTVVIFLILLGVLVKFAFPAILGYANARELRIQEILDAAAQDRAEAERLLEEQRRELAGGRQQAQQILADARQAAERLHEELTERTRAEQSEMIARAKLEIERESERAAERLRREAVELALAAAGKLVGERIGADEDRQLVSDYLGRIESHDGVKVA